MTYFENSLKTQIKKDAIILAIESSCDETACSVIKGGRQILSSEIISSVSKHIPFGGVVPEIASRAHTSAISITVDRAVKNAGISLSDLDAIAVTYGAGLLGALLVGVSYAKALAYSLDIPLVPVSHIRGHLSASYLNNENLKPPFISVLCSGGHTAIIEVKDYYTYNVLGKTLDDAVGEAFDKVARVLGLEYPGGPNIEKLALSGKNTYDFPKMPMSKFGYNFSYSGLKTAVINTVNTAKMKGEELNKADVACSFQETAIDMIVTRAIKAVKESGYKTLTVGGGVGANGCLREKLTKECEKLNINLVLPPKSLCTDNAAMIGAEGYLQYLKGNFANLDLNASANVNLQ
ncbi:MAG: tRNA (adenosine(37)-N6)-threonylcarbamoyltransferase complex transferase subunit TsaD [Clostridia bacterium]|nr:tRNA (adenosine(37)-N6)-threonylcarbamoyltransferase complex transferase subunit TsaD [Clostridia bacterium]